MTTVLRLLERLEDIERNRNVRRVFVDRQNPLECLGDEEIFVRYRFRSRTILYITDLVSDRLMHPTRRSLPLTPLLQLLVFLRFLASGAFHLLIGDSVNIGKATAGRCIRRVGEAISSLAGQFIVFPTGNGILQRKSGFYAVAVVFTKYLTFRELKALYTILNLNTKSVSTYQHDLDKLANIYNKPFNCLDVFFLKDQNEHVELHIGVTNFDEALLLLIDDDDIIREEVGLAEKLGFQFICHRCSQGFARPQFLRYHHQDSNMCEAYRAAVIKDIRGEKEEETTKEGAEETKKKRPYHKKKYSKKVTPRTRSEKTISSDKRKRDRDDEEAEVKRRRNDHSSDDEEQNRQNDEMKSDDEETSRQKRKRTDENKKSRKKLKVNAKARHFLRKISISAKPKFIEYEVDVEDDAGDSESEELKSLEEEERRMHSSFIASDSEEVDAGDTIRQNPYLSAPASPASSRPTFPVPEEPLSAPSEQPGPAAPQPTIPTPPAPAPQTSSIPSEFGRDKHNSAVLSFIISLDHSRLIYPFIASLSIASQYRQVLFLYYSSHYVP
ncbi:hypothetical protein KUTeg_000897 [Tegillarca granosa]|uniref:C2H2-type domain-containing protein n=1 Tax=Tegillarca granosa TaxID=220873 RepID=A0ABQ9FZ70_TEGGR|nr:hypothetical protein KUTeg_000897 [Tegillarca granosa]